MNFANWITIKRQFRIKKLARKDRISTMHHMTCTHSLLLQIINNPVRNEWQIMKCQHLGLNYTRGNHSHVSEPQNFSRFHNPQARGRIQGDGSRFFLEHLGLGLGLTYML